MELSTYIACLCEGTAEEVIINILLDNDKLIFNRSQLIEETPLRCREARTFETRYLRKGFSIKYPSFAFWIPAGRSLTSVRHISTR